MNSEANALFRVGAVFLNDNAFIDAICNQESCKSGIPGFFRKILRKWSQNFGQIFIRIVCQSSGTFAESCGRSQESSD